MIDENRILILPSGLEITGRYIPIGLFDDICKKIEDKSKNNKIDLFSSLLIKCYLREDKTNIVLNELSDEDIVFLIEAIAEDLGYLEEYNSINSDDLSASEKLYAAHRMKREIFSHAIKEILESTQVSKRLIESIQSTSNLIENATKLNKIAESINIPNTLLSNFTKELDNLIPTTLGLNTNYFANQVALVLENLVQTTEFNKYTGFASKLSESMISKMDMYLGIQANEFLGTYHDIIGTANIVASSIKNLNAITDKYQLIPKPLIAKIEIEERSYESLITNAFLSTREFSENDLLYPPISLVSSIASLNAIADREFVDQYSEVRYEALEELGTMLDIVNPNLTNCLIGARDALTSNSPDWPRHFGASSRELLTLLLSILAPNDLIWDWSTNKGNDFNKDEKGRISKNRPTRSSRLNFIISKQTNKYYRNYIQSNFRAIIELIDYFSNLTHSESAKISPEQAYFTLQSLESFIYHILKGLNYKDN